MLNGESCLEDSNKVIHLNGINNKLIKSLTFHLVFEVHIDDDTGDTDEADEADDAAHGLDGLVHESLETFVDVVPLHIR